MHVGEHRAGTDDNFAVITVDRIDRRQPAHAQHHLATPRDAAPDQSGVPALRNNGRARRVAGAQDGRDFLRARGTHDSARRSREPTGPVGLVPRAQVGVDQDLGGSDDRRELLEQRVAHST